MPINILMPALSPTMEKGNLAKWLKKEGDAVKTGDVIAEIETDKATMEDEAVDDGVMAKIVVPEGTSDVPVNQLIAVLAQEGEDPKTAAAPLPRKGLRQSRRLPRPNPLPAGRGELRRSPSQRTSSTSPRRERSPPLSGAGEGARTDGHGTNRDLLLAAGAPPRQGGRHRHRPHRRIGSARPRRSPATWRRRRTARACARRGRRPPRRGRLAASRRRCRISRSARSMKMAATKSSRTTACAAPSRSGSPPSMQTIPHFYLTIDCDIGKLARRARGDQRGGAEGQGRQAGLQAFGQRFRHQGAGACVAARAGRQRELDRSAACSSTSMPTSASRWRCRAA